jgi:ABC-type branched-subunit amino acid transport system ATPase component
VLYVPGSLAGLALRGRDALLDVLTRRRPPPDRSARAAAGPASVPTEPPEPVALSLHGVHVRYGGRIALDGVDLHVDPGEVVGLIGANGAGKSTLMDTVSGFVPHLGRIELGGLDLAGLGPAARSRAGLGRSFQDARLFDQLTVHETLALACRRSGGGSTPDDVLAHFGLGPFAGRFCHELSTGTRRIVELASLFAARPRVLLLDEPTAGVAQRDAEAFGPLVRSVAAELGASALVIEHDMPLIMAMSDRVYCLEVGTVIACGPPRAVRDDPRVIASYLGTDAAAIDRSGPAVAAGR